MQLPFDLKYKRNYEEALDFAKHNTYQKQKMINQFYRLSFVPIAGTGLYSLYLYLNNVHSSRVIFYLSIFIVMLVLAIVFSVLMDMFFNALVLGLSQPLDCDLQFNEDGLTGTLGPKNIVFPWGKIKKVQKYKNSVVIYGMYTDEKTNMPITIITSNAFTSISQNELIEFIESKIK